MLIERQTGGFIVKFLELGVEPMWKAIVDLLHGLPDARAARGSAAAPRLVRDRQGNAFVERRRDQSGLAVARVANHGDASPVDITIRHQVIHRAMQTPRPGGDRAPVVLPLRMITRVPGADALRRS